MINTLVVSPHRDDASFSCAISIRELTSCCSITISNYFTVSEYAPYKSGSGSTTKLRKREDELFAAVAGICLKDLDLIDAPERLAIDLSEISADWPLCEIDATSQRIIRLHIESLSPQFLLAPLAIGHHIDHRIAQAAALETSVASLAFYEDLPYSARVSPEAIVAHAAQLGADVTPFVISSPTGKQWKHRCASLYTSQIDSLTVEEIANFSDRYQQGERLWVTPSAATLLKSIASR